MGILRSKLQSGAILSVIMLTSQIVNFFIVNLVANKLGLEDFGRLSILLQDFNWFLFIRDFGMTQILISWYHLHSSSKDSQSQALFSTCTMNVMTAFLFMAYIFIIRNDHPNQEALWWTLPAVIFNPSVFDWLLMAHKQWWRLFIIRFSQVSIYSLGALWFLNSPEPTQIIDLTQLLGISYTVSFVLGFILTKVRLTWLIDLSQHIKIFKEILTQSTPIAIGGLVAFLYYPLGFFLVDWFHPGDAIVGVYNTSHRLIHIASMLMVNFLTSDLIFNHSSQVRGISWKEMTIQAVVLWSPLFLISFFFGEELLTVLFFGVEWNSHDLAWAKSNLIFLSLGILFQGLRNPMLSYLINKQQTTVILKFQITGALTNLIVALSIYNKFGVEYIALCVLSADLVFNLFLTIHFFRNKFFH